MREGEIGESNQLLDDIDATNRRNHRIIYAIIALIVFVSVWVIYTNWVHYVDEK